MSKNECKRCSECKHYERVNDNEPEDHGDCTLYPTWLDVPAAHYCGQWAASTVQEEQTPLDIDWSEVPEGYDWAAQDSNGNIYAYNNEPLVEADEWANKTGRCHFVAYAEPNPEWSNTLTKRLGTK